MQATTLLNTEPASSKPGQELKELARHLAEIHTSVHKSSKTWVVLTTQLRSWEQSLQQAYQHFRVASLNDPAFSRAGEWMLDNFYVVEQTFHQIEEGLPSKFVKQLPKLDGPLLKDYPRVFALASEWIGYCQSRIDLTQVTEFVLAYQQVTALTIGELWALPIMLRIGILEQLVLATAELTGMDNPPLPTPAGTNGNSPEPAPSPKNPDQAASLTLPNENIVAACFLSLRLLSATDWKDFFEKISRVEQILRTDPARIYAEMDFNTRNSYRTVIEELAQHSASNEEEIAATVIGFAQSGSENGVYEKPDGRKAHVGYYLRGAGLPAIEQQLNYQPGVRLWVQRALLAHPTSTYLGSIAGLTTIFVLGLIAYTIFSGATLIQQLVAGVLGLGLALEAAIIIVNLIITNNIKPQSLPRMDFSDGISPGNRTMVVVPTLLESSGEVDHLLQGLELSYLTNPDPQLSFALLTDFGDAPTQTMPEDEHLLALARAGIEKLNQKYTHDTPFYLFHRHRQWNPSEGVWMGWERKRGKLADFNRLLLNLGGTAYTTQVGNIGILGIHPETDEASQPVAQTGEDPLLIGATHSVIKYVITLDADTLLPQGSANRLVATLAHPLNHAKFAADGRSVVAGYTVLQPRVSIKPTSANRSRFSQIFSGNVGFDLYSFAVSDVYQDMFGEGSYVGKGIYDVAAFERSLAGQVRQNTLLSHDLFEGIYGRAALVTDIVLYEEYPSRYLVYARRLSRWIRGDWQLLPWLFPFVRTENGVARNRLSAINLWKVFDNLRRSLLQPTLLALLVAGWLFLPGSPVLWTLLVLLPSALPMVVQTARHVGLNLGHLRLRQLLEPPWLELTRWILAILFLPYEALLMLSAIGVTIRRLLFVRKHMLQWTTAAHLARSFQNNLNKIWLEMSYSLAFSVILEIAIRNINPGATWVAAPLLIGWLIAPEIAYWLSQPVTHRTTPLSQAQRRQLHRLARRTWAFFEQFAGPDDHWLPPDHFQESPRGSVAHYTTPTNIGLYLASTMAAYDFGYVSVVELAVRLRSTFESMDKLEHYRGHLLNWYDSQTMTPLPPRYVSTVDSGNLAACLIALKQGCLAMNDAPVLGNKQWQGLLDILDILSETLQALEKNNPHASVESFEIELTTIFERVSAIQNQPAAWNATLAWLSAEGWERVSNRLLDLLANHPNLNPEFLTELQLYLNLMQHHLQDMQRNLDLLAPWLGLLDAPPESLKTDPAWQDFLHSLPAGLPSLEQAVLVYDEILSALDKYKAPLQDQAAQVWCQKLEQGISTARLTVKPLLIGFQELAERANGAVTGMEFRFLFNEHRQVFHIGYNVNTESLDPNYYDLLASEARIASLVAIARGDVPQSHWQHLGRPVTKVNGKQVLLSWSGTMFEYLMPTLFTKNYAGTFLSDSCYAACDAQIRYGRDQHVPWGFSESGFYAFDTNQNYQYRAFGVPDLGYKRDLSEDLVVAPYASLIALSLQPQAVLGNMTQLEQQKGMGRFGFYEALDYTKKRLPAGQTHAVVQSYMAHHQAMIFLAASNYLLGDIVVRRFHADEHIQSVELLLQEKIPQNPPFEYPHPDESTDLPERPHPVNSAPWRVPVDAPSPQAHVLSQGDMSVMVTSAGGGYSQWREFALTRWQADSTLDDWGTWIYIQDRESGALWSATCQPIGCAPEHQDVQFFPHKVEFQRSDNGISLRTGITVSPEGVEIRRVNILNDGNRPRRLKLTSYGEVVLAAQAVDRRHPAFNKLFIESEFLPQENALVFQRRLRSSDEKPVVLIHAMLIEAGRKITGEHESDRALFLGRSQTARNPLALQDVHSHLSGTTGATLDPIFSLAQEIDLKAHAKTRVTFITLAAPTRLEALEKLSHYRSGLAIYHAFEEANVLSEEELINLGLSATTVENFQHLLSALLYPSGTLRAAPHILAQNKKGQSGLWAYGISGDYPIMLAHISNGESALLTESLQAFKYWRNHHVTVNLVVLNDQDTGYSLDLQNSIQRQIVRSGLDDCLNQHEGIFVLRTDQLTESDRILLETVAGVILDESKGSLAEHAGRLIIQPTRLPAFTPSISPSSPGTRATSPRPAMNLRDIAGTATSSPRDPEPTLPIPVPNDLLMPNGLGGFSRDGREYIILLEPGQHTPRPWVNVIANPEFGFLVSEAGSGCTWAQNSGENRLTPWRNDPVTDQTGEALYLRDEEIGLVWSPTPMPAGAPTRHVIRHGAGYSIFESQSHGLNQTLRLFAAPDAPVKIAHLRLKNLWDRPRRVTVTYYAEWVLGTTRDTYQAHIMPEFDPDRHALLAINLYNSEFAERMAFLAASKKPHGVTADRTEFLGHLGSLQAPAALGRIGLASAVNAGLDPCAAIQLHVDLAAGSTEEVFFLIGEGANREQSLELIAQIQVPGQVEATWHAVQQHWDDILNVINVKTPDPTMDLILNRWLLYQTISCRLWGRTALYQSSGAFGFRDQLQDVMALLHTRPDLVRAHLLETARHQFGAGDVLHWWHPPSGRGVRTRISDDLLWLPYVTAEYVTSTGDVSILNEKIPFLNASLLKPEETERYAQFEATAESYSLYEHCLRALKKGSTAGVHGLPLMGSGDWNDGMNLVGAQGRGESIWLGWFLHATLTRFCSLCVLMKEDPQPYRLQASRLAEALEQHAWDGNWYLRAYYDSGSRLGSSENNECRIDSIAQSWAVLSGAASPLRAEQAMVSVNRLLIRQMDQLILLLAPPFDNTIRSPGYIQGYPPGIRENGGQYTHAAIWAAWAFAKLGDGERAGSLFHLLNPIQHADTPEKAAHYMVEPYGVAADIYSQPPHTGTGGWTGYTGSAGWMYRLGIEAILGLTRQGDVLMIEPCIPRNWPGFQLTYRSGKASYLISVENPDQVSRGVREVMLDGVSLPDKHIPLSADDHQHEVRVIMGMVP